MMAVWALGNVAGDSPKCRDLVLANGALISLLHQLNEHAQLSMLRNASWTLSNFCKGKPQPVFEQTRPALPAFERLIHSNDEEVLTYACWALSYLSDGTNDKIQAVIEAGVCPRLVELLLHPSPSVLIPTLRTVGNIVTRDDMQTQEPVVRPLHEFDSTTLQTLLPEIPSWVKMPDYERVDWLNRFVHDMWPYLDKAICNTIRSMTKPIFDEYIGKYYIESIDFDHLTLGTLPPIIHGVKVVESQEKSLVFEPGIRWASNCNITVTLKLLSLKLTVQVLDVQISLAPRVTLKPLVPCFPCFANLTVCLMEKPHVDFGLKLLGGDLMAIPVLYQFVQDTIAEQIANLYHWPKIMEIPILENASEAVKKPVGILHVKVVRALNLMKMDFLGKSDPYVKLSLSGEGLPSKRTSIKMSNLNPEWNEQFKFIVKDPGTQVLQLHLFDWEKVKMHDKLGMQVVPLSLLTPYETKEFTLDLLKNLNPNDPQNKRNRGKIIVDLTFGPFREEIAKFSGYLDGEGKQSIITRASEELSSSGGVLSLTIEGAEDVEGSHHNNPYALILFRGEHKQTKVIKKTRDPRWNEEFQFVLEEAPINDKIHIQVMSKRRGFNFYPKESLGHVDINLVDVVNNGRIIEAYHLINSKNGVIHIELRWSTV